MRVSNQQTPMGVFQTQTPCHGCNQTGKRIVVKCTSCNGQGLSDFEDTVSVDIPKGVSGGMTLQMNGKGNSSVDGHFGDLLVHINEEPHTSFKRVDNNLVFTKQISVFDLLTGAEIEVDLLSGGTRKVKIDKGTKATQVYEIKGFGLPSLHGGTNGHLYVELDVNIPILDDEKLNIIKSLKQ